MCSTYTDNQSVVGMSEAEGRAVQRQLTAIQVNNIELLVIPGKTRRGYRFVSTQIDCKQCHLWGRHKDYMQQVLGHTNEKK